MMEGILYVLYCMCICTHHVQPCLFDMEYFSMIAVRRSKENFCSRLSWPADWLLMFSEVAGWLRGSEVLKLGQRRLGWGENCRKD